MTQEIIALETSPKIGMFSSIAKGFKALFKNPLIFLQMCITPLLLAIATSLPFVCAYYYNDDLRLEALILLIACTLIAIPVIIYLFWRYLVGITAVSYLAKDIYENKPVKKRADYFSYVDKHSSSLLRFYCWDCLLVLVLSVIFIASSVRTYVIFIEKPFQTGIFGSLSILSFFGLIVLGLAFTIAQLYWAYNDKSKPLKCLIEGLKFGTAKIFQLIAFSIILGLIYGVIILILKLLSYPVVCLFSNLLSYIATYIFYFIFTRYYFDLTKN